MSTTPDADRPPLLGPVLVYTLLRVVAFVGCFGVLLLVGLRGLVAIAAALLVSSTISLFVMKGPRDRVSSALLARREAKQAEQARLRGLLDGGAAEGTGRP